MKVRFQLAFLPCDEENNNGGVFDPSRDGVYLCGSLDALGVWNLTKAVEMNVKESSEATTTSPPPTIVTEQQSNQSVLTTGAGPFTASHLDAISTPDSFSSYSSLSSVSSLDFMTDSCSLSSANNVAAKLLNASFDFEVTIELDQVDLKRLLDETKCIQYKYFIAQKASAPCNDKRPLFLKQVEYNWRQVDLDKLSSTDCIEINDKWPLVDAENRRTRIDSGWLVDHDESEIQFHFFNQPLELWSATGELTLSIRLFKKSTTSRGLAEVKDYYVVTNDFDENQSVHNRRTRFNSINEPSFYSSHRIRFREKPNDLIFQINLHDIGEDGRVDEKKQPVATGYYKVNKYLIENSLIDVDMSLMSGSQIVGTIKTEILLIMGVKDLNNTMIRKNFNYHFNKSCIPIGHRGMGKTFDAGTLPTTNFVENTIESFREAYNRGAQMVEFDIVLTKDKVPVVYHDFVFCIDQLCNNNSSAGTTTAAAVAAATASGSNKPDELNSKLLSLAVNQLTYDELKRNRIYSQKILKKSTDISKELKEFFTSKFMFPTLREMCTQLDSKLGFNVEIKYPIDLEDGSHEVEDRLVKWLNRNEYVDCILKELYECCKDNNRCVILSAFDPNLCSILRMKQNKFPVLFLTNGVTNKWVPYKDARCKKTSISLNFAKTENLHGIVVHAEELTKNLHLINILFNHTSKSANFLAYSWGDDLNEFDKRRFLSDAGLNGIIYDRINESK